LSSQEIKKSVKIESVVIVLLRRQHEAFRIDIGDKWASIAVSNGFRCTVQGLTVLNRNAPEVIFYQDLCHEFRGE
jgi:hypothetical protein